MPVKQANEYAKSIKAQLYQTSAKDGTGIAELYSSIAEKLHLKSLADGEVSTKLSNSTKLAFFFLPHRTQEHVPTL